MDLAGIVLAYRLRNMRINHVFKNVPCSLITSHDSLIYRVWGKKEAKHIAVLLLSKFSFGRKGMRLGNLENLRVKQLNSTT